MAAIPALRRYYRWLQSSEYRAIDRPKAAPLTGEFEVAECCRFWRKDLPWWSSLSPLQQAEHLAHYREHNIREAYSAHERDKFHERERRRNSK